MKPTRKLKKSVTPSKLVLEEIIGLTTKNANGLASNVSTSNCAYLAGSVVVVYNVISGTQSHLMVSHRLPRPLSCLAMSQDGRFIAAGEAGNQSSVLVWDSSTLAFVCELKGHLYGATCISFSPDGKHLASVGRYIYLWDWQKGVLVTKLQASSSRSSVSTVSFSSDAKYIITAGKKHLKFWALGTSRRTKRNGGTGRTGSSVMHEKPLNVAFEKGSSFISITSSIWSYSSFANCKHEGDFFPVYALTDAGILYLVQSGILVKKSVDLKVKRGFALSASEKLIACACNDGIVKFFTLESLEYVGSVVYSKGKKHYEESGTTCFHKFSEHDLQHMPALPDAVACQFSTIEKLVVIYEDHSLKIWDIHNVNQATRCFVLVSHSSCIWDIKNLCCENKHDPSLACVARGCCGGVSFATCSADGTIRLWDLDLQSDLSKDVVEHHSAEKGTVRLPCLVSAGTFELDTVEADVCSQGFRSLAVSSDGKYLAAGDCKGNIHIYNLQSSEYTCLEGAHDAEVLSLSFTMSTLDITSEEIAQNSCYLASGGRDCIIHLFDVRRNFDLIDSIDDHSAAVTSIKITGDSCKILSCSADSFLVLRDVAMEDNDHKISQHHRQKVSHGTIYDMAVDPTFEVVVTVGQDKKVNTFDIAAGKLLRSYKQYKDFGEPIKVTMDPSCSYVVCSYSSNYIGIYDFFTGEMVAKATGHAEVVTGVIFSPDCKHIVSVDGDGCVFVWKLPAHLSSRILKRIMERSKPLSPRSLAQSADYNHLTFCGEECKQFKINPESVWPPRNNSQSEKTVLYPGSCLRKASDFKFSVSRLPKWAQAKVTSSSIVCRSPTYTLSKACNPASPEVQKPSDHLSSSPEFSPMPEGSFSNFALDKNWLSVYTVCMDALSSPEMQNLMDTKISEFSTSIQDKHEMSMDQISLGDGGCSKHDKPGHVLDQHVGCNKSSVSWSECFEEVSGSAADQLHLDESGSDMQAMHEDNLPNMQSEDSDLFKQHFGSLSKTHKRDGRKSFVRRYSARYVVQQDYPGECTRLFSTPVRNMTNKTMSCEEEPTIHIKPEETSLLVTENSIKLDVKNLTESSADSNSICELTGCPVKENSLGVELGKGSDQNENLPKVSKLQETIILCKEAMHSLDAAAENTTQLFSILEIKGSEEPVLGRARAQLFDEAAELLPSIIQKVNAIARLVQCRSNDACGNKLGVSGMNQLLGRDESILDKIEVLKENTSTQSMS